MFVNPLKYWWDRIIHYKFALWKVFAFLLVCIALCIFALTRLV